MEQKGLVLSSLSELQTFSEAISKAVDYLPKHIQKLDANQRPWAVMAAIQMGTELGLSPMSAINNIAVVNGVPTIWGDMMLGLVIASGQLESIDEYEEGDGDNLTAICKVKRKGFDNEIVSKFSIADAKKAGLWAKAGPWQTHPKRMLKYKSRAFALRDRFADILKGLHSTEEMEGEQVQKQPLKMEIIDATHSLAQPETEALMKVYIEQIDEYSLEDFREKCPALMDAAEKNLSKKNYSDVRSYAERLYKILKEDEARLALKEDYDQAIV